MTAPTMADHRRDAVRYPACGCGAVWKQRGNLTGHCTRCHHTFDGIELFDRHQTTDDHGTTHCKDPRTMRLKHEPLILVDGTWRGPRMPDHVIAARFGSRRATEQRATTAVAAENPAGVDPGGFGSPNPADGPTGQQ
jgi:hypothetical protein